MRWIVECGDDCGIEVFRKIVNKMIDINESGLASVTPERTCTNVSEVKRMFECSDCGYYYPDLQDFKHCPECGARIIGDDE